MSIQEKQLSKNGKSVTYYYPVISTYRINKKKTPLWGPGYLRKTEAKRKEQNMQLRLDELLRHDVTLYKNLDIGKILTSDIPIQKLLRTIPTSSEFKALRNRWLETRITKNINTAERDETYCSIYLSVFDDMKIENIDAEMVQKWVNLLTQKYAPKTVNLAFNLLSQIMDYAISPLHILEENPCRENIARPVNKTKGIDSQKYWSEDELKHFITHPYTKEDSYYFMYVVNSTFGMRPGEVCGISVYDLTLSGDTNLITLNHGLDKKNRLTDLKNSGAQRTLRIPDSLIQLFKDQICKSDLLRSPNDNYRFLFLLNDGSSINPDTYCQHFQRLIARINAASPKMQLKPITPYGLRHTFATLSLLKGVHIKAVAEAMGDAVETVMRNYAHILEQMTNNSLELMSAITIPDASVSEEQ